MDECPNCGFDLRAKKKKVPAGCKCDPDDWMMSEIPAVCSLNQSLVKLDEFELCSACGHLIECHSEKKDG